MPPRGQFPCGKCDELCKNGGKGDERSVQCNLCEYWFHMKCIPGMNADFLDNIVLAQEATGTCFWACKCCKSSSVSFLKKLSVLEKRIKILETNVLDNLTTTEHQNSVISDLTKKVQEGTKEVQKA